MRSCIYGTSRAPGALRRPAGLASGTAVAGEAGRRESDPLSSAASEEAAGLGATAGIAKPFHLNVVLGALERLTGDPPAASMASTRRASRGGGGLQDRAAPADTQRVKRRMDDSAGGRAWAGPRPCAWARSGRPAALATSLATDWAAWSTTPRPARLLAGLDIGLASLLSLAAVPVLREPWVLGIIAVLLAGGAVNVELGRHAEGGRVQHNRLSKGLSAWPFAAAVLLPVGVAGLLAAVLYAHCRARGMRVPLWKWVHSWAIVSLASAVTSLLLTSLGGGPLPMGGSAPLLGQLLLAAGAFLGIEAGLLLAITRLNLPEDRDYHLGLRRLDFYLTEFGVLAAGTMAAILCRYWPGFLVLAVPGYVQLQRAVLYRDLWDGLRRARADLEASHTRLRASEERFRSLVQHASDVTAILDTAGQVTYVSPAADRLWGRSPEALHGTTLSDLVHPDDRAGARGHVAEVVRQAGSSLATELRLQHADGTWRDVEVVATNLLDQPAVAGIVLTCHDVTERKRLEEQLVHQAFHDPLTGLANRALLADRLDHALVRAGRRQQPVGVLLLDLDDFKLVNDSLGHQTGDRLLQEVAARVQHCLRTEDTAARLGGDEFAVLLEAVASEDEALAVAERLTTALQIPVVVDGRELTVGVSIGLALSTPADERGDDLVRRADLALYRAKADGKGTYALFDTSLEAHVLERLELESDLRHALGRDELQLVYQPILTLDDGRIGEVEALLRWHHPRRGLVAPTTFIPVAEATGLIVPIGAWVLEEGCRQLAAWDADPASGLAGLGLAVNVSPRQLQDPGLLAEVHSALEQHGLAPERLTIEITESALGDGAPTLRLLQALKDLGVRLSLDDFGTGYSSLARLRHFPVDTVKIDRSFVQEIEVDRQAPLVSATLALAGALRLSTVAEGVETEEQERFLREQGCDSAQGFRYSRPLPAELPGVVPGIRLASATRPLRRLPA
jgi:diguanylate cyclase (GGDEF)-like protein/PAS domain S-box-containing protein